MAEERRYGRKKYTRPQVVAVVAGYWRKGWTADDIAKKLGTGRRFTQELCEYLARTEGHHKARQAAGRSASGSAGTVWSGCSGWVTHSAQESV